LPTVKVSSHFLKKGHFFLFFRKLCKVGPELENETNHQPVWDSAKFGRNIEIPQKMSKFCSLAQNSVAHGKMWFLASGGGQIGLTVYPKFLVDRKSSSCSKIFGKKCKIWG